ncbi:hypothetical protein [Pseudomonas sp. NBRC 111124]|uniref:hypothetical protein n=1 Tax=Pseudomonas sp. NBRC 111124 TaxID=1661039 RepID=UPI000761B455|nr:hypothetical protein [Pseudomonas sp. NBRC 111124]
MGWLSKVKGFFSKAVQVVKEKVVEAVNWLADKAETFVGEVKRLYKAAKPYISKARMVLRTIAANVPVPWVQGISMALDKALAALEHLDSHPLAAKVDEAIKWIIARARDIKRHLLNDEEVKEAEQRAADLEAAMAQVDEAGRQALECLAMSNRYELVRARISRLVEDEAFVNFEHYLRIRAVQKLLPLYEEQMEHLNDINSVLDEPLFIIQVASQLIEGHAELDDAAMERLDSLTTARFGKPVIPFVFEEMINVWGLDLKQHQDAWEELSKRVSRDQVIAKRLNNLAKLEPLPIEEAKVLADLEKLLPTDQARLDKLASVTLAKRNYVYAAEGFLQLLENDEQRLIDQDREYLMDDGFEVGELLIRCAQNGEKWENLKREEQSLIISFANIFEADCRKRAETFTQVEVAA